MFERILDSLDIGKIREINEFVRERALEALRDRLVQIGLASTSISNTEVRFSGVIGGVSIANRNIDFVELERKVRGGTQDDYGWSNVESMYRCSYIVQARVAGFEKGLKTHSKSVRKGIIDRHYSTDIEWKGKELAQVLNRDASILLNNAAVLPNGRDHLVVIRQKGYWDSWVSAFPTSETFEVLIE